MTEKKQNPKAQKRAAGLKPARAKAGTSKQAAEDRRKRFAEAYIANGGNATEAAKAAGYSEKTARQQGARLLSDVSIQRRIAERRESLVKKYELTTEMVTRSIVQELNFDPGKLYDESGNLKPLHELDEDTRMVLSGVEFVQFGSPDAPVFVKKVKWAQRHQARDHAMKHLGMFEKDNRQKNDPQVILSALATSELMRLRETLLRAGGDGA
jgi:phage terminase small subunit